MAFAYSVTPTVGVGTISIAKDATTVTGVGTNFTSPSLVNQIILVNGFVSAACTFTPSTLTAPNGGEYWGGTQTITWDSNVCDSNETVDLFYKMLDCYYKKDEVLNLIKNAKRN
jgi:hypothetical protein